MSANRTGGGYGTFSERHGPPGVPKSAGGGGDRAGIRSRLLLMLSFKKCNTYYASHVDSYGLNFPTVSGIISAASTLCSSAAHNYHYNC